MDGSGSEPKCITHAAIGMIDNQWYVEHPRENTNNRVRLYVKNKNGEKWYLRAHFLGRRIGLVCEDLVKNIGNVRKIASLLLLIFTCSYGIFSLDGRKFYL